MNCNVINIPNLCGCPFYFISEKCIVLKGHVDGVGKVTSVDNSTSNRIAFFFFPLEGVFFLFFA